MNNANQSMSLRRSALFAGLVSLIMVICAPFSEIYAFPKLLIPFNGTDTLKNIFAHQTLFAAMIMAYVVTFTGDILVAWALYILLKPVNLYFSALAAIFRLVFAVIAIDSLLDLIEVFRLVTTPGYSTLLSSNQLQTQVILSLNNFRYGFHFGTIFFGAHLIMLGFLVWKSNYIPSIMSWLLLISGIGYMVSSIQPYLFPSVNIDFVVYTFYGELIFIIWLLVKGSQIKVTDNVQLT